MGWPTSHATPHRSAGQDPLDEARDEILIWLNLSHDTFINVCLLTSRRPRYVFRHTKSEHMLPLPKAGIWACKPKIDTMYWYFLLIHSRCPVQSVARAMSTTQQVEGIQYKFILFGFGLISILGEETIKVSTFRCFAERKSLEKPRNYGSSKHTSGAPKKSWKFFTRKLWRFRELF